MNSCKAIERKQRIEQLGSFGKRKTQVIKDKTKYSRKEKWNEIKRKC